MAVGGIGSFSALTSYSGVNSSKANSELEFDKIYQQKTDSVEINSTAGNNDIMTIYEMLCSEFPEANYILEDRSDEKNLFFNNVDTRIGKDFGNPSKKNVFIDVGVIKKIQEDPSYYLEAKLDLQQIIEHYDEARTHGGSDLPYTTGELDYENGRIQAGWRYDSKCCQEAVAKEVKKLESPKLSDAINYDYRSTHGGKELPYMTANLDLDGDRLQVSWQYEKRSCSDMIAKEIKNIESHKLSDTINYDYIKDKMDTMLDNFMDKVTEGIVGEDKEEG